MIDLHTHTLLSDGALLPSELVNRAAACGYTGLAITDHCDSSNIERLVGEICRYCASISDEFRIRVVPGVEITHVEPALIADMVVAARALGARIVVCHGETIAEPVPRGTNIAAINARVDILTHPGLITDDEARVAAENSVLLEITCRAGHSITNGHVAMVAKRTGAGLVINTDAHAPGDLVTESYARTVLLGAGLTDDDVQGVYDNSKVLLDRVSS